MSRLPLPFRQIHLDFHTHESIEGIGADFDPQAFAETLARAHVNSINLFARGHHGYIYYDTKRFAEQKHPHLTRNLLAEQIEACHARGIQAPIYVTVQWDAYLAERHPEWLVRKVNQSVNIPAYTAGFYNHLCVNSPYFDWLKAFVADIFENLPVDGFWFDIVMPQECSCRYCREGMIADGLDPAESEAARLRYGADVISRFRREMTAHVRTFSDECLIFYNRGHIGPHERDSLSAYSHLELESLPHGWGYHYFPTVARYARGLHPEFLGMTGKFHTAWGDFHSFKNEAQLACECFTMLAMGGKCCIGYGFCYHEVTFGHHERRSNNRNIGEYA